MGDIQRETFVKINLKLHYNYSKNPLEHFMASSFWNNKYKKRHATKAQSKPANTAN